MTLSPLRCSDPDCGEKSAGFIARQAARPESWRDQWPDDPDLLKVRDIISGILQREYGFQTDAFLPDDEMAAIWVMGDEFRDPLWIIVGVEEAFDIAIDDEMTRKFSYSTTKTYLDFVKSVLDLAGPDYEEKFLQPLSLPVDYHQAGRSTLWRKFPVIGRDSRQHNELRWRQAKRPDSWADRWPDDSELIALRDKISRFLVDRLEWPNPAFVPDDQLAALFHCKQGREFIPVVLPDFNQKFNADLDIDFIINGGHTYLDLLGHIQAGREK